MYWVEYSGFNLNWKLIVYIYIYMPKIACLLLKGGSQLW